MIITFFRSSSYNKYDFCPQSYFIEYVLGIKHPSGKKACLGNIVHKALECLARKKLAIQNGDETFSDEEGSKTFKVESFSPANAIFYGFELYKKKETHHNFDKADFKKCEGWMYHAMELNGGLWNPLNHKIIYPEKYFDIEIKEDWARYKYSLPNKKKLDGYLGLKGTIDLVCEVDNSLFYIDWKTGMRKDWATGKVKNWKDLRNDPQLRIYHYAISKVFPQYENIVMNIVFTQDGGAYSLDFGPDDLPKTTEMLKKRFEIIRNCDRPRRIIKDKYHNWKCKRLCNYGMTNYIDKQGKDSGKTICDHLYNEVVQIGMDKVYKKYSTAMAGTYMEGGGLSNRDEINKT